MILVIKKRLAGLSRLLPLLLAFEFAIAPVIFGSRGFDLPRLKGAEQSISSASRADGFVYFAFLAHHKRASSRTSVHQSFFADMSSHYERRGLVQIFLSPQDFLLIRSIHSRRLYRPPAVA